MTRHCKFDASNIVIFFILILFMSNAAYRLVTPLFEKPALQINSVSVKTPIFENEPLVINANVSLNKQHCDISVTRTISEQSTGKVVWLENSPLQRDVVPINGDVTLSVKIPDLRPNGYYYQGILHMVCQEQTYSVSTRILPFTVEARQ